MKRGILVLLSLSVLVAVAYFTASKWAIRHETIAFHDPDRDNRLVAVHIAVRRDKEMQADAGLIKLPVAVLNHGNTVKNTEYSFLANLLAARGYLVASIQQDLPTDPPLMTNLGLPYVGRREVYMSQYPVCGRAIESGATECRLRPPDAGGTLERRRYRHVLRPAAPRPGLESGHA